MQTKHKKEESGPAGRRRIEVARGQRWSSPWGQRPASASAVLNTSSYPFMVEATGAQARARPSGRRADARSLLSPSSIPRTFAHQEPFARIVGGAQVPVHAAARHLDLTRRPRRLSFLQHSSTSTRSNRFNPSRTELPSYCTRTYLASRSSLSPRETFTADRARLPSACTIPRECASSPIVPTHALPLPPTFPAHADTITSRPCYNHSTTPYGGAWSDLIAFLLHLSRSLPPERNSVHLLPP